ncbi:ATP-binding cassette domain-containing protein [Actinomyces wuliandei]|uniref:ATP-binding cassette domain-containing protein n=1 Tax=Actinomyces wuliandei TaxID=2057743 RepID=UPI0019D499E7|nr:ABC transporter ATP-binding protein [Actinomyces wuliandei]
MTHGTSPRPEHGPLPSDWLRSFTAELTSLGVGAQQREQLETATRLEAEAAGLPPAEMYGPAALYARELAAALRSSEPARQPLPPTPPREVALRLTDVCLRRGRRAVLDQVSLELRRGEVLAVVGTNGAGKSSLLQVCAGVLRPTSGQVERCQSFGYAPQLDALSPLLTVDEHLSLFGCARGATGSRARATGYRLLSTLGWNARGAQTVGTLSGGTQQKVSLSLAQLDAPHLLLLDEPYQGLDSTAYEDLWGLIRTWSRAGTAILLVTHLLRDVDRVDQVIELAALDERTQEAQQ